MRISDWSSDVCSSDLLASTDCQLRKERRSRDRVFQSPPCRSSAATYGCQWPVAAATAASPNCCIYSGRFLWALLSDGYELHIATNAGKQKTGLRPWVSASGPSHFQLARVAPQIGRAHVRTPVTNAHLLCRLLPEKNNN